MNIYKNIAGDSGVSSYEIGSDYIKVEFKDGSVYLYNNASTGFSDIQQMKLLANMGVGLNSFIGTNIKKRYAKKIK